MGKQYSDIPEQLKGFIEEQKVFFVATATATGHINLSPKGMDTLRVLSAKQVIWLNVTGSGNETAAHVQENPRMTLMFAAFSGNPLIVRLYGQADVIHRNETGWDKYYDYFKPLPGARQIIRLQVELVQSSCGMGVPLFEYVGDREQLNQWAITKGESGIKDYWRQKNRLSLDGHPTFIEEKNL